MPKSGRREFLRSGWLSLAGVGVLGRAESSGRAAPETAALPAHESPPPFKLGMGTYDLAKDWDIETIIKKCEATRFEGLELRTTQPHRVEPSHSKERPA